MNVNFNTASLMEKLTLSQPGWHSSGGVQYLVMTVISYSMEEYPELFDAMTSYHMCLGMPLSAIP